MKKLILSALLGIFFICGCEKSIQLKEETDTSDNIITEVKEVAEEKVYAFHLDNLEGTTICNPVTAEMLNGYSTNSTEINKSTLKTSGNFNTKSGMHFEFSATSGPGGEYGVGYLTMGDENDPHLRYNITSLSAAGNIIIFQGVITKSFKFSEKYAVGNNIIFNLEDNGNMSLDRYNAAIYTFSPHLDRAFYHSDAWMGCGKDCFPEEYYLSIESGEFTID